MLIQANTYQNIRSYEKGCMAISTTSSKPLEWQAAHNISQQREATFTFKEEEKQMYLHQVNSNKLTSNVGNRKRELPEKWFLRPLAKFPIAWMASIDTAMFTSVISYSHKDVLCKYFILRELTVSNK